MKRNSFIILLAYLPILVMAQDNSAQSSFGLFESEELLNVTLRLDIARYMEEKPREDFMDAIMTFHLNETDSLHKQISLRTRGSYRYTNCNFPPVLLNLRDLDAGYSDLDDLKNVKLVSHCMPDKKFEVYILREYLAYKMYNIISDYSFRVRLLRLDYIDINYDTLFIQKYGFLIEPVKGMKKKFQMDEIEDLIIETKDVDSENMLRVSLFQYLIANSDWHVPIMHNMKIFGVRNDPENKLIAVPYDFDFTGWVDADYAVARDDLGLEEITDRAFFGPCGSEQEYTQILDEFLTYKDVFIETIKDFKYLKGSERRDLIDYVRSFFRLYRDNELLNICMEACKNN